MRSEIKNKLSNTAYLAAAMFTAGALLFAVFSFTAVTASAQGERKAELTCGADFQLVKGKCTGVGGARTSLETTITTIVNLFTVIVGIIAVIMIIYGGFRYITSGGDQNSLSTAKNTIIYAVIGLIIVALAQIITRFVIGLAG